MLVNYEGEKIKNIIVGKLLHLCACEILLHDRNALLCVYYATVPHLCLLLNEELDFSFLLLTYNLLILIKGEWSISETTALEYFYACESKKCRNIHFILFLKDVSLSLDHVINSKLNLWSYTCILSSLWSGGRNLNVLGLI